MFYSPPWFWGLVWVCLAVLVVLATAAIAFSVVCALRDWFDCLPCDE